MPYAGHEASAIAGGEPRRFERLSRDYLDWYFRTHPVRATQLGIHRHDAQLPDMSRRAIEARSVESRRWLDRLHEIGGQELDLLTHAAADDLIVAVEPHLQTILDGGYGLGLYLCKRIIEAHGGAITIDSVKGKFTTAKLTLPI